MCGGGYFQDSIILATGATGTGKTMLVSKFVEDAYDNNERAILFAYEESRAQLLRNATSWGIDFEKMESDGLLKIICAYPESTGLEDHLQIIKTQINQFKPKRMAIDSLSALARGVSLNAFRQFVIAVTGYTKQEEIAGFFTNTAEEFMGSHSITDSHISTITDTILLLQYVEIKGEMARALNVFKMRGSWHDKRIREFIITNQGPEIRDSFSNFEQIFSGAPHRVIPGFMAQGGCPNTRDGASGMPGTGGPGYNIKCEINSNKHLKGSLSMAHAGKDTGGSQFFIVYEPQPHLDGVHTVFGMTDDMDVVLKLTNGSKILKATLK